MQTKFADNKNPWTNKKMSKANRPIKPAEPTDISALSICNDPPPAARQNPEGKYTQIFDQLKPNQRLKCPSGSAGRIGQQLRKYLEKKGIAGNVKTTESYGDGHGGVWIIKKAMLKAA